MTEYNTIRLERSDADVALLTFNRPEVRNALSHEMVDDIRSGLDSLAGTGVRALILTGAGGKAFISGADISELRDRRRDAAFRRINTALFRELELFEAPTIAAIQGFALGGGCELAMACDLRIAGQGARFGQPEVSLGIIPGAGGTYRLPRLVGIGRARELIFTGRIIDAREALDIGLVEKVVPDDEVLESAYALAAQIAANSPIAVRMAKTVLNSNGEMSADVAMALEATTQAVLFEDPGKFERMTAFLDRKAARKAQKDATNRKDAERKGGETP
ncbi:MAG: enoyl-CoA hydratase/carnithine racemase [Myxococcota bacterium]|jgi:enoyl-CoA hydratase/carnithine racemase